MKKPLIAALIALGVTGVTPAAAQDWRGRDHEWNRGGYDHYRPVDYGSGYRASCDNNRAQRLYFRIRRAVQTNQISWRRAQDLRAAVDRTASMQHNFCARGLNDYQASRLDRQWDRVENLVDREARG